LGVGDSNPHALYLLSVEVGSSLALAHYTEDSMVEICTFSASKETYDILDR